MGDAICRSYALAVPGILLGYVWTSGVGQLVAIIVMFTGAGIGAFWSYRRQHG